MRWVVEMVMVEVTGVEPVGVTVAGEAEQVVSTGNPVHPSVTTELKPATEVTPTVMLVAFPATTVARKWEQSLSRSWILRP